MYVKTHTRVRWGLFDITAKENAVLSSSPMLTFGNLRDLQEDTTVQRKYATLEQDQTLLDGSFEHMPLPPYPENMGYWSYAMSDSNGMFEGMETPWVEAYFPDGEHASVGLTLTFHELYEDYPDRVRVTWYDENDSVISFGEFLPDSPVYFFARNAENYRRIVIEFLSTAKPYRYIKVSKIDYGTLNDIDSNSVISAKIEEFLDPVSSEIRWNTLDLKFYSESADFSPLNPEGVYEFLQQRQLLEVEQERIFFDEDTHEETGRETVDFGGFYLESWGDATNQTVTLSAVDIIGVIDKTDFEGGIYNNIRAGDLIKQIMESANAPYYVDPSLEDIRICGHLPIVSHREALRQVCFRIGALANASRKTRIDIVPQVDEMTSIIYADRVYLNPKPKLEELVTGIRVISHDYTQDFSPGVENEQLCKGYLEPGDHSILFSQPMYNGNISGGIIMYYTPNRAIVRVTVSGEVTITGRYYFDNQQDFTQQAARIPANTAPKVIPVEGMTLVSAVNSQEVAARSLLYHENRHNLEFSFVHNYERVGDLVVAEKYGGGRVRGWITRMEYNLTNGRSVKCVIKGKPLAENTAAYMPEIYMDDEIGVL